jgi:hypothetical protein
MTQPTRNLPRDLSVPHPDRLSEEHPKFEEIISRHDLSMALGQDGYKDPDTGDFVFNAKRLAENGKCCAMACRHCPFKR